MQLAWSRIWTRVAVSISYDDNHYTTGTSLTPRAPQSMIFKQIDFPVKRIPRVAIRKEKYASNPLEH